MILILMDEMGREQERIEVTSRRFTIGRIPENDLAIEHPSLSRRHAVIEMYDPSALISDCGSQNGTMVNGAPVASAVELHDGDIITLGGARELAVSIPAAMTATPAPSNPYPAQSYGAIQYGTPVTAVPQNFVVHPAPTSAWNAPAPYAPAQTAPEAWWLSTPVLAGGSVALILLVTVLLVTVFKGRDTRRPPRNDSGFNGGIYPTPAPSTTIFGGDPPPGGSSPVTPPGGATPDPNADQLDVVEGYALAVMRSISNNDTNPVLPQRILREVNEQVQRYRANPAALRGWLATMRGRAPSLASATQGGSMKLPFLVYAGLAKADRDGGDPVQNAQGMAPTLFALSRKLGNELASDWLIVLAAFDQGVGSNATHPLQITMSNLTMRHPDESRTTIRTFWYLHDQGAISDRQYSLVIRFLAIGVIAQNPAQFGVGGEPLALS